MENLSPGTSTEYLTLPEMGAEAETDTSGMEADTKEVEDPLQDELNMSNQQVRSAEYLGMQSVTACNDTCIRGD